MAKQDKKNESYEVEQRINKAFVDPGTGGTVSVSATGSEPRNTEPVWVGDGSAKGIDVQSPDAADRNLEYLATGGSVEPRDIAPTWIGDGDASLTVTGAATDEGQLTDDLQITDSATDIAGGGSVHQE